MLPLILPWNKEKDREEWWCMLSHWVLEGEHPEQESYHLWIKAVVKKDAEGYRYYESNSADQSFYIDHVFKHFLCIEALADQRMEQFEDQCQKYIEDFKQEKGYPYASMSDLYFHDNCEIGYKMLEDKSVILVAKKI